MSVGSGDMTYVSLVRDHLSLNESTDVLNQFMITDSKLERVVTPRTGLRMTLRLKRKITSEIMTTFFPSILLLMITFATTFFKPFFFEAALSVNLTNMLVMTTIFVSVMEKLPLTAYPKMIDIWLIFCQLVPFTEVFPL